MLSESVSFLIPQGILYFYFYFFGSRFTVVLMKICPKSTKSPYNKLQPSYPHESTCLVAETPVHGPFKIGVGKRHFGGAYLHIILSPKQEKISAFFQISRNCCCLRNTMLVCLLLTQCSQNSNFLVCTPINNCHRHYDTMECRGLNP